MKKIISVLLAMALMLTALPLSVGAVSGGGPEGDSRWLGECSVTNWNDYLTRLQEAELVVSLYESWKGVTVSYDPDLTFPDTDAIAAKKYYAVMELLGFFSSYADGTFRPDGTSLRFAIFELCAKIIIPGYDEKAPEDYTPPSDIADFDGSQWYVNQEGFASFMCCLANYQEETFRPYETLTARDAYTFLDAAYTYVTTTYGTPETISLHYQDGVTADGAAVPEIDSDTANGTFDFSLPTATREGYALIGWNTEPDGSGVWYVPGKNYFYYLNARGTYRVGSHIDSEEEFAYTKFYRDLSDLYAQWQEVSTETALVYWNNDVTDAASPVSYYVEEVTENSVFKSSEGLGFSRQNEDGVDMNIFCWDLYADAGYYSARPGDEWAMFGLSGGTFSLLPKWAIREIKIHYPDCFNLMDITYVEKESEILSWYSHTRSNMIFMGYNSQADGGGTWFTSNVQASCVPDELWAIYEEEPQYEYVILHDCNGYDTGGGLVASQCPTQIIRKKGSEYTLPETAAVSEGGTFCGWTQSNNKKLLNTLMVENGRIQLYPRANGWDEVLYAPGTKLTWLENGAEFYAAAYSEDRYPKLAFHPNGGTFLYNAETYLCVANVAYPSIEDPTPETFDWTLNWLFGPIDTSTTVETVKSDGTVTESNLFETVPEGKSLVGWNTKADGTGTLYSIADWQNAELAFTTETVDLYAQWEGDPDSLGSDYCGSNAHWAFDEATGTLSITGTGNLFNWWKTAPWEQIKEKILHVTVASGITSIGVNAFKNCINMESVSIPDTVSILGAYAFYDCKSLKAIELPDTLGQVGSYALSGCSSLTELTLPSGMWAIPSYMLSRCSGLTCLEIPSNVSYIYNHAFEGCTNLGSISVPSAAETIVQYAFYNCPNLTKIYYGDVRSKWETVSGQLSCLEDVKVICTDDLLEFTAGFQITDIPGGKQVILSYDTSENLAVYYTVDDTSPSTDSIPYTGPFTLTEAGEYKIRAVAYDAKLGKCSLEQNATVILEQSEMPVIQQENNQITISASGDTYYNFDLAAEPTVSDNKYTDPVIVKGSGVIRAKTIENGRAASETAALIYTIDDPAQFQFPEDSFSFPNSRESFGYNGWGYKIPKERYAEVFGKTKGKMLYDLFGKEKWDSSSFGMSAAVLLFQSGMLSIESYGDAETLSQLPAPGDKNSPLTQLIEKYEISQYLYDLVRERNAGIGGTMAISGLFGNGTAAENLIDEIANFCDTGEDPVILILWGKGLLKNHAVVPYAVNNDTISVYDCDYPGETRKVTFSQENGIYTFTYGEYSAAVSINRISTLLNAMENLQTGAAQAAVLTSKTSDADDVMLLSVSAEDFTLKDAAGAVVEDDLQIAGDGDLTLLYLPVGDYSVEGASGSGSAVEVAVSTDQDYYAASVADSSAAVEIGVETGHLYARVNAEAETAIQASTLNTADRENGISLISDYAEVSASQSKAIDVKTNASVMTANGKELELSQDVMESSLYSASVAQKLSYLALEAETYAINTSISALPGGAFALPVTVTAKDADCVLCVAAYNGEGKMLDMRYELPSAGTASYSFPIPAEAAKVKAFLLQAQSQAPLAECLTLTTQ